VLNFLASVEMHVVTPSAELITRMVTSRAEMTHEEGGGGRERESGILHMTKVLFGDVKVLNWWHKNQHTVLM
jgi:hypothetical protein